MPIKATDSYKAAAELNHTLAMANIAFAYIKAGLKEEATNVLDKAKQQKDMHPNIGKAISFLAEKTESEAKVKQNWLTKQENNKGLFRLFPKHFL